MPLTHKHAALIVLVLIATLVVYGYWQDRHGVAPHTPATPAVCPTPAPCGTCPGPPAPLVCPPAACAHMSEKPVQGTVRTLQGWAPGLDGDYACISAEYSGAEMYIRITPGSFGGLRMHYNASTKAMSMNPAWDPVKPTVVPPAVMLSASNAQATTVHFSVTGGAPPTADGSSVAGTRRVFSAGAGAGYSGANFMGDGTYTYIATDAAGWDAYVMDLTGWDGSYNLWWSSVNNSSWWSASPDTVPQLKNGALILVKFNPAKLLLKSEADPAWPQLTIMDRWALPVAPGPGIPMPGRMVTFMPD